MDNQPSADPHGVAAVTPSPAPESTASGEPQGVSWQALKDRFLEGVQAEGFAGVPEPDRQEFAPFLAKLNARNPALARELVQETRRLRRGLELPSSAAARRRERSRDTRRVLLMRQTPDGRWVLDKQKAPVYGMLGLLALGGLLTAIYALPKLDGKSALVATPAAPNTSPDVSPAPVTDSASREALERSREQLRQVRANKTVAAPLSPAAKSPLATTPARPKALTTTQNPPPPPTVPVAPARSADFQPVADTARTTSGFQPQRGATSPSTVAPQSLSYAPSSAAPGVLPFGADSVVAARPPEAVPSDTPPSSRPAPPVTTPRLSAPTAQKPPASPSPAGTTAPAPVTPTPPPVVLKAPAPALPPPLNIAGSDPPAAPAPALPDSAEATTPFGGDFGPPPSVVSEAAAPQDPPGTTVTGSAASSPTAFARGMVYERKPQAGPADQPTSAATPPPTSTSTGTETPFGSDAVNPPSKIGATGPFTPLQQIPATLLTGIRTPNGGSVPVVAVTAEGGSFVGVATVNAALARVDILFRRYIAPDGNIHQVDALAYARDGNGLTQGIPAAVEVFAPTLALDAAQNSANALNTYVQNAAAAALKGGSGTTINLGDGNTLSGPSAASLAQTLLGGLGATFKMPENTQSILRVASVKSTAPMIVIAGLGGGQ
ncbi:hypothetical protein [Deinococcus humi]|uniref:Uncharacterized protein n=1 Tax=Deinococcus humi TaxID=662880 RepID=A0A7W8NJ31_9DEIO|nr:hypothetical protein [Deinococcus humi]MBB5365702.1 hypothetical protein [Deinococcus humi]GGO37182.1 hypothetical protein GCM10008949_42090 [Deinococcus humi]